MRLAILALLGAHLLAGQTFSVVHMRDAWWNGGGTVEFTDEGITYTAEKEEHSRDWTWLDIQHFDRISENEFEVLTYEDQRRYLGRDRSYRFRITDGSISDDLFERIAAALERPVTDRVIGETPGVNYTVPVKHLHTFGGCEGELRFTDEAIYYVTDRAAHSREWRVGRDLDSVWSRSPYQFEVRVYENNRREFSSTRIYEFDLKRPLDQELYRELKLSLFRLNAEHLTRLD
jgi:hypothetical protein